MAFNSSALTAGIGSMIQGIQSSAQQKLQLAQMERQKRIEDANLIHQRAMEDLARQGGIESLNNTKAVNPIQRRILGTQASLGEGLLPSQIRSAEQGVIGQDIANRSALFNVDQIMPLQKEGMFNANRISKVQGNIAEGTQDADITLKKQVPEGNQFTATSKLRSGFDEPLKTIQSAIAVLDSPTMSLADKQLAYKEYNTARTQLASMPGYIQSAEAMPSLFGNTTGMRSDYLKRLGGKEGETDLAALVGRYAPARKAPTIADTLERFNIVPGIIQGVMSSGGLNPRPEYIDRGNYNIDVKNGPSGTYRPPTLNVKKMADLLIVKVDEQINHAARASGMTEQQVWKEGFGLSDKDFVNGKPNLKNADVRARIVGKMTAGFIENKDMREALLSTNAGYEEAFKNNLSAYLASINKGISKAQIEATLKQLAYPLINSYIGAFEKANVTYNKIEEELRNVYQVDPKLVTLEAFLAKMKKSGDAARAAQGALLYQKRAELRGVMQSAVDIFANDAEVPDAADRAARAIKKLLDAGFTADATNQGGGTGGAPQGSPGNPPPPGQAQLGVGAGTVLPNSPIATPSFVPRISK